MVSLRSEGSGGGVAPPTFLTGDATAPDGKMSRITAEEMKALAHGRDVLFVTHGFNVSYRDGLRALGRLQDHLALGSRTLVIGILWPGDFWIPVINYPWEASDAVRCGNHIADWCNKDLGAAASISFISHSLGGRLILQATLRMQRKIEMLCLTAAAVDKDVLTSKQYAAAYANCKKVHVLSSARDRVLKMAYPAGDFFSDLFGDDDSPFRAALGRHGPMPFPGGGRAVHDPIAPTDNYDHGDYLPSTQEKWKKVAAYMKAAILGQAPAWP